MTLDELLALLPDNTSGEISAEDLRTIVSALWANDEDLSGRVGALEAAGGVYTITGVWQVNTTVGAAPASTQVTKDQASFATTNWLRFAKVDVLGDDLTAALMQATVVYGQMRSDRSRWVRYDVDGPATDGGTYVQIPVAYDVHNGGNFTNGQNALFAFAVAPAE